MKVILKSEFPELGEEGDIVDVNEGYARNYLIPTKRVIPYNRQNVALLESQKHAINLRKEERRKQYISLKERIEETKLMIKMKVGEKGHLYGAVTSTVIAEHLEAQGIEILKKQIVVPAHHIKEIGAYTIGIKLLSGIVATLNVVIESDAEKENAVDNNITEHNNTLEHIEPGEGEQAIAYKENAENAENTESKEDKEYKEENENASSVDEAHNV